MIDWLEAPWTVLRPITGHPIRVEDFIEDEFRYGTFSRSLTLPAGADEEHTAARYGHGILDVTVKLAAKGPDKPSRRVPVRQDQHIKPT
jgi:HSP20 family molecular chaperone IbpA